MLKLSANRITILSVEISQGVLFYRQFFKEESYNELNSLSNLYVNLFSSADIISGSFLKIIEEL